MYKEIEYRVIEEVDDQGRLARRVWRDPETNFPHHIDGPAVQSFDLETGDPEGEIWIDRSRGGRHRPDNLPAETSIDVATGVIKVELYYRDGHLHRDDGGPAEINRDPETGRVVVAAYHLEGKLHRENGQPAVQEFDAETGRVTLEEYHRNGLLHRDEGPAIVSYDSAGNVIDAAARYYQQGQKIDRDASPDPGIP
ncbi:MAG: hypothetical protein AAFR17_16975 [Pseudomonadota bacterium]